MRIPGRPSWIAAGDFDHNGFQDLVVSLSDLHQVALLLGVEGLFESPQIIPVGQGPQFVAVADLDADGYEDLVVSNQQDDTLSLLRGLGDGTFDPPQVVTVGDQPLGVVIGDFNQDHAADLAVMNAGSDDVSVLLATGIGGFFRSLFLAERTTYDSFGTPRITGPGSDGIMDTSDDSTLSKSAHGNPYAFTGREYDSEFRGQHT